MKKRPQRKKKPQLREKKRPQRNKKPQLREKKRLQLKKRLVDAVMRMAIAHKKLLRSLSYSVRSIVL
jgi:hypothetical protein